EDGIRDRNVTGVQTCALPISSTNTTDISLTTVSGSTKASTNARPAAHARSSWASCWRIVSPGARGGLKIDFDLFLRKGLNTIVHPSHCVFSLLQYVAGAVGD